MHILVTGAAGFIGYHLCRELCQSGHSVVGLDNLNDYYSPKLKRDRLGQLSHQAAFSFVQMDLADHSSLSRLFKEEGFSHVINMAAQAGVRHSIKEPFSYVQANLVGFANLLEACRHNPVEHLVYASSSSVYGLNSLLPYTTAQSADHPISLYAATKKSNEVMAHAYSHLYGIPSTGLRFFTVYGPWGRPDMALFIFTKAILEDRPIPVFNQGQMLRDFTYIDDIVAGVTAITGRPATADPEWQSADPDPAASSAPYRLYNIGNNAPIPLLDFIQCIESALGKKAVLDLLPMQTGDVRATYADIEPLRQVAGFAPRTPLKTGVERFVQWYLSYHSQP